MGNDLYLFSNLSSPEQPQSTSQYIQANGGKSHCKTVWYRPHITADVSPICTNPMGLFTNKGKIEREIDSWMVLCMVIVNTPQIPFFVVSHLFCCCCSTSL